MNSNIVGRYFLFFLYILRCLLWRSRTLWIKKINNLEFVNKWWSWSSSCCCYDAFLKFTPVGNRDLNEKRNYQLTREGVILFFKLSNKLIKRFNRWSVGECLFFFKSLLHFPLVAIMPPTIYAQVNNISVTAWASAFLPEFVARSVYYKRKSL